MKATAGLHHALRADYRLTYEPESAKTTMHGFLNLVLAATLLAAGKIDEELAEACLDDDRPEAFKLSGRAGSWLNGVVTYSELSHARRSLLRSVGSCSFEEPIAEIDALDFGLKGVDLVKSHDRSDDQIVNASMATRGHGRGKVCEGQDICDGKPNALGRSELARALSQPECREVDQFPRQQLNGGPAECRHHAEATVVVPGYPYPQPPLPERRTGR